jgi:hypothetical protein
VNRRLVAAATLVLVAGVAVVVFGATRRRAHDPPPAASTGHGAAMDQAMGAVVALYHAPEGATPCETAYNAFKASLDLSTLKQLTPVVLKLAPRDQFLATCSTLPPASQQCLVPMHFSEHRTECAKAKPPQDVLDSLVQLKHQAAPGSPAAEQQERQEPPAVPH